MDRPGISKFRLAPKNVTVAGRFNSRTHHAAGGAVHATRKVDCHIGTPHRVHGDNHRARQPVHLTVKSRAEQRVDDQRHNF